MYEDKNRKQINIRLEKELYDFLVQESELNYTTMTAVVRSLIVDLLKRREKERDIKLLKN